MKNSDQLVLHSENKNFGFSQEQVNRYSRQLILPEIGVTGQEKIRNAKIIVIGAGGIGSSVLIYLASMGVGTIGIVDGDSVDVSNLHRQVIHSTEGISKNKTRSAKDFINALNPEIKIICYEEFINQKNVEEIIKDYHIAIDGSDNPLCRYIVNDACKKHKVILVSGAAVKWESQITLLCYKNSACYRCIYPECPNSKEVLSCANNGVIGTAPGITGIILANQSLKIILGLSEEFLLFKKILVVNTLLDKYKTYYIKGKNDKCILCNNPDDFDIKSYDYKSLINGNCFDIHLKPELEVSWENVDNNTFLLDVRPTEQHNINNFPLVKHIPIDKLISMSKDELEKELIYSDCSNRDILVFCKSGINSQKAVHKLRNININAFSLSKGLNGYRELKKINFPLLI